MHVAILVPSLHGGGAEFVASQWAYYLRTGGDKVTVLTTHAPDAEDSEHLPGAWFGARLRHLRKILQREPFDTVLAMAPHWNLLAILATIGLKRSPRILISGRTMEAESRRMGKNKKIEILLAKILYRRADGFIAISHPAAAEAQAMFSISNDKIWVVPNPASAKIKRQSLTVLAPREQHGDSGGLDLVVPARLVAGKRPRLAFEIAVECARISGRTVNLHFFGSGVEEAPMRDIPHLDDVKLLFHGWVEDWYLEAPRPAVVLLPSRIEGFANVLVEAAYAGLPSVASSRAFGVADAMVPGMTGILTLSSSVQDFAHAVIQAEQLEPTAASEWLKRFSLESSGSKLKQAIVGNS